MFDSRFNVLYGFLIKLDSIPDMDKEVEAEILHVYRTFVFLYSRDVIENGGVFVTKNTNVAMMAASSLLVANALTACFRLAKGRLGRLGCLGCLGRLGRLGRLHFLVNMCANVRVEVI